jgi:Serine endopeptidase inhibitors
MNQNELQQPFFAQFLEGQKVQDKQENQTSPLKDPAHTLKYPSDGDETLD